MDINLNIPLGRRESGPEGLEPDIVMILSYLYGGSASLHPTLRLRGELPKHPVVVGSKLAHVREAPITGDIGNGRVRGLWIQD